jgi:hypothetical protein
MFADWRTLFFAILWTCVGIFVSDSLLGHDVEEAS